jgi:hypothetical protein
VFSSTVEQEDAIALETLHGEKTGAQILTDLTKWLDRVHHPFIVHCKILIIKKSQIEEKRLFCRTVVAIQKRGKPAHVSWWADRERSLAWSYAPAKPSAVRTSRIWYTLVFTAGRGVSDLKAKQHVLSSF